MIDQFLYHEAEAGKVDFSSFRSRKAHIVIHGHCHQKAIYDTKAMKYLFGQIEGLTTEEIPSGCCGMAGSFGYEKEHAELSRQIGERTLLPAVRALSKDDLLVASGVSCRHQIGHHTDREARHWVEVMNEVV